jgi:capsular polysaccharide transport system permease protein
MFHTSLPNLLRKCMRPGALRFAGPSRVVGDTERSIRVWLNIINALLLRDVRVRAGKFYVGYLVIFLMPFAHLAVLMIIFVYIFKRTVQFGNQPLIFFGISVLPFVIFIYPSRQTMFSLGQNRPLLYFPRVKIMDVIIARGILEFANGMAVSAVVCLVLFLGEGEFLPRDPFGFLLALVLTLYLGFAWGAYNALIVHLFKVWAMGFSLCFPLLWAASGVIFNVHGLPANYAHLASFNPLLVCTEFLRYAYYEDYPNDLMDTSYVFWFATSLIASAFVFERIFRRQLLEAG